MPKKPSKKEGELAASMEEADITEDNTVYYDLYHGTFILDVI